ncbi:MAG: hypothetical protein OEY55_14485, partial [Acidimicrobiia bacterium]|nr:hypothetical protein [Acidimicrobiia bacterium]
MRSRAVRALLLMGLLAGACTTPTLPGPPAETATTITPDPSVPPTTTDAPTSLSSTTTSTVPLPPAVPSGPLDSATIDNLDALFGSISTNLDREALRDLASANDVRVAWL